MVSYNNNNSNDILVIAKVYSVIVPCHKKNYLWECIESYERTMSDDYYDCHYVL